MNSLFMACVMILSAPPEYEQAIYRVSTAANVENTYISPLAYGNDDAGFVPAFEDPVTYEEIRFEAIYNCKNVKSKNIDINIIDTLIKIEKQYDVPPKLRGMLLAAACSESGYNPKALGDWRTLKRRGKKQRVAKAVGLFQMWPWWTSKRWGYGVDRNDVNQTAHAFMRHIKRQLKKIKCKRRSKHKRWIAAWVTAIRAPKSGGRCKERPLHLKYLKRWHKNIKRTRIEVAPGC